MAFFLVYIYCIYYIIYLVKYFLPDYILIFFYNIYSFDQPFIAAFCYFSHGTMMEISVLTLFCHPFVFLM